MIASMAGKPLLTHGATGWRAWVLSIGVNDYGGQATLPSLTNAVNDACLIFETLTKAYNFEGELLARAVDIERGAHPELLSRRSGDGGRLEVIDALARLRRQMLQTFARRS